MHATVDYQFVKVTDDRNQMKRIESHTSSKDDMDAPCLFFSKEVRKHPKKNLWLRTTLKQEASSYLANNKLLPAPSYILMSHIDVGNVLSYTMI